ncbi:uncharacterized protein LOC119547303 isoform X3 [Drosophila subpulchrella]|uniref:uncharacterized protein LOC119547303 isoform X3 n=1 Tax=Drosophila subpulchrella TaxID=1486046 RepID=UPI0018A13C13|nr:uncharacterized protein LOC119547303 isoform X3 [Drosophila subpulchrella]
MKTMHLIAPPGTVNRLENDSEPEFLFNGEEEECANWPLAVKLSSILSRVEKLVTTMLFRFHNGRVLSIVANRMSQKEEHRKIFESGKFFYPFPFAGPNFNELCHITDEGKVVVKDLITDLRFAGIVAKYEESQREEHFREAHRRFDTRKVQEQLDHINAQELNSKRKFCADVIESMRKWTIWSGTNNNVKKNIFQSPENVEGFFMKVKYIIGDGNVRPAEDLEFQEDVMKIS